MEKKVRIEDVCRVLEIPVSSWTLESNMSTEQAKKCLEDFQKLVKKQRKTLAKKYHPDKLIGDEVKMKIINDTVDIVMKLEITKLAPKPQTIRFHFSSSPFNDHTSDTTSFSRMRFRMFR